MAEEAEVKKSKQPKAKKVSKNDPAKTYANKMRKLQRHLNKIARSGKGSDVQAEKALERLEKKGSLTPRRTPHAEKWTRQTKELAHQHRICGYNGNFALKFGQEGVSVYAGMKEHLAKYETKRKAKFLDALNAKRQQEDELRKAEKQKQVDVERKKFHNNQKPKGKKPNTPKKPVAKPKVQQ